MLSQELPVRVLRFQLHVPGFRPESVTLVTTMIDVQRYPVQEVAQLYARRWKIELWFRDIKTSMGMDLRKLRATFGFGNWTGNIACS